MFSDLETVRETGQAFHAVTLFQVLEHIEEPLRLLMALRDIMTAGAVLVLEVPDCSGIRSIHSQSDYYNIHPLEHINCFTPESLRKLAERAGFKAESPLIAHATADVVKVIRGEAKRWVQKLKSPGTNRYFRRA